MCVVESPCSVGDGTLKAVRGCNMKQTYQNTPSVFFNKGMGLEGPNAFIV
jgi:hypothetical protein